MKREVYNEGLTVFMNNAELFRQCLLPPEPLIDPYYCAEELIISEHARDDATAIMRVNSELIDRITTIQILKRDNPRASVRQQLEKIAVLLEEKNVNFTEFTSFFPVLDVSYSIYSGLSRPEKLEFLEVVVAEYIAKRHAIYQSHGYSAATLQVRKDFEKHKTGGSAADRKIIQLLRKHSYSELMPGDKIKTSAKRYISFSTSLAANQVLDNIKESYGLVFEWQAAHQGKIPDFIIFPKPGCVFICECKHMKEAGGGQDKQVSELISLIGHAENNKTVGYISYLDGIYFNKLINPTAKKSQPRKK